MNENKTRQHNDKDNGKNNDKDNDKERDKTIARHGQGQ